MIMNEKCCKSELKNCRMENKIERMTDMISDGVNNLNPSAYCDMSSAEKVRMLFLVFSIVFIVDVKCNLT